jgi:NADPH:quinone reductase-like Zn-dependent oxidoreductase
MSTEHAAKQPEQRPDEQQTAGTADTMEAMVLPSAEAHGGVEGLVRAIVPRVAPGPREVEVEVRAVAMNHMDVWVRRGLPHLRLPYPFRLGCDLAGVVSRLGPGVSHARVGDAVMLQPGVSCGVCAACLGGRDNLCKSYGILGENRQGGYGRFVVVPEQNILPKPTRLSFEEAAALPLCLQTAWQMVFDKARLEPGQTILAHAAGSGVTSLVIQLAKLVGARVLTTTSSAEKAEKARALGADEVIRYDEGDWTAEVKRLTGKLGPDVIFDHVGGEIFEQSVKAVRWGGRIVTVGATARPSVTLDLRQIFFRQVEVLGSTMGSKATLWKALPLVEAGKLRPVIDRVVPLWEARAAHEALEARRVFGKIVLSVSG